MTKKDENSAMAELNAFIKFQTEELDHHYFHHQAGRALFALNRKLDRETSLEELAARLSNTLTDVSPATLEQKLSQQALVLDAAFNWLMTDGATNPYGERKTYQSAFEAQKLFRQSLQLLKPQRPAKPPERTIKRTDKNPPHMTQKQWDAFSSPDGDSA